MAQVPPFVPVRKPRLTGVSGLRCGMVTTGSLAGRHAVLALTGSGFRHPVDRPGDDAGILFADAAKNRPAPESIKQSRNGFQQRDNG
ncbi:hypothetical protein [Bosea sp. (in: a-proteobacteria)]|jgi:hypothetical protein|uniref:hypothetical protein n=1 Tax=Bosea sp. (in: a-proteobacteria) TaxID=1871050 RepID=UPI003F6EF5A6